MNINLYKILFIDLRDIRAITLIKILIFVLHGWLLIARVEALGNESIILAPVLLKLVTHGLLQSIYTFLYNELTFQPLTNFLRKIDTLKEGLTYQSGCWSFQSQRGIRRSGDPRIRLVIRGYIRIRLLLKLGWRLHRSYRYTQNWPSLTLSS